MSQSGSVSDFSHPGARWRWGVAGVLLLVVIAGFFDRISIAVLFTNQDFNDAIGTGFNPAQMATLAPDRRSTPCSSPTGHRIIKLSCPR